MGEFLMLDARTLAFASAISGFLMAMSMLGIYLAGMRTRAVLDWFMAGLAFGMGYLLGHLLLTVALPVAVPIWFAGGLANALIGLAHGLILIGVQRYLGVPVWTRTILGIVALLFLSGFLLPELRDSLRFRVILHSGWYVLIDAWAGLLLWRATRPGMRRFHRVVAAVLLSFAAFLSLRLGYALISPALTTSFVQDPFQIGAFLAAMAFGYFLAMALVVMLFREKQMELVMQARRDPLTGMNNRLSLTEMADVAMSGARRCRSSLSLILLDLDHFKQINDTYGHQAGDAALKAVADRLELSLRESDTAFRFGGEEFLVLLPGANADQAVQVAERFRKAMAEIRVKAGGNQLKLTASFGVVEWRAEESWDDLVKRADQALYRAKRGGRDQVVAPIHVGLAVLAGQV